MRVQYSAGQRNFIQLFFLRGLTKRNPLSIWLTLFPFFLLIRYDTYKINS
jgi:hypothetical protein